MRPPSAKTTAAAAGLFLLAAAYANHFQNGFHFDDAHAIVDNVFVRDPGHIPRYFTDATTFSVLPLNQSYRPLLQTTFAIDYWMGGGYNPVAFQADTFAWYLLLLAAAGGMYAAVTGSPWIALVAVGVFALHPVSAETVNYIVQRGDLLSTLGVVAALYVYARWPSRRRRGWYLLPFVLGALAKPPALVFPLLLAAYVWLFERRARAVRSAVPSLLVAIGLACWIAVKTPPAASTGAESAARYLLTQPFVALRYFGTFFAPVGLSADNDWPLLKGAADPRVPAGLLFLLALALAIRSLAGRDDARPVAFGLAWFAAALLPTSLTPLAEVANDHRMFFPFVGLSLAAVAAAAWAARRVCPERARGAMTAGVVAAVLVAETAGVRARNEVWRNEETLWRDVTVKSPRNGRGWMNYAVALMEGGDYAGAAAALERGLPLSPNYSLLEVNLGVALGHLGRAAEAERHFLRAVALAPSDWRSHLHFARWLGAAGRPADALAHARLARELNPADPEAASLESSFTGADGTAEYFLSRSLAEYRMGRFRACIASAARAIALRPAYAEAFNNVAAGHIALGEWDAGLAAAREAVRLAPSLAIARNNLEIARRRAR